MSFFPPMPGPAAQLWPQIYRRQAAAKAGVLTNGPYVSVYEDFRNWTRWIQYAGSQSVARTPTASAGGGAWRLNAGPGQNLYYHLGNAANDSGFTKVIKAKQRWHVAVRLRLTAPAVFPMVSTERIDAVSFESGYGVGPSIAIGMKSTRSTSKWSAEGDSGVALLSTKNLSNLWTTLEMWCDTSNLFLQVTDTLGTEAPQAYSDFAGMADTIRGMAMYYQGAAGSATSVLDKILLTVQQQTT